MTAFWRVFFKDLTMLRGICPNQSLIKQYSEKSGPGVADIPSRGGLDLT